MWKEFANLLKDIASLPFIRPEKRTEHMLYKSRDAARESAKHNGFPEHLPDRRMDTLYPTPVCPHAEPLTESLFQRASKIGPLYVHKQSRHIIGLELPKQKILGLHNWTSEAAKAQPIRANVIVKNPLRRNDVDMGEQNVSFEHGGKIFFGALTPRGVVAIRPATGDSQEKLTTVRHAAHGKSSIHGKT